MEKYTMINLILPENNAEVSILTEACKKFYDSEDARIKTTDEGGALTWSNPQMVGEDCSTPLAIKFSWDDDIKQSGLYILIISEKEDLSDPIIKLTEEKNLDVYNLCTGTKYYWCIQKANVRSETKTFTVKNDSPRLLYIEGLNNVRDIGGYKVPGGKVKMKMLYRGSELENSKKITEKGLKEFFDLKIKTHLDLRGRDNQYDILELLGIKRLNYITSAYNDIFKEKNLIAYRKIMLLLGKANAYPIYIHCIAGADRTGVLLILIGAILGMNENDLYDEYELTSLSSWGTRTRNHVNLVSMMKTLKENYGGSNINETVENFMIKAVKLTPKQIQRVRDVLIEKDV